MLLQRVFFTVPVSDNKNSSESSTIALFAASFISLRKVTSSSNSIPDRLAFTLRIFPPLPWYDIGVSPKFIKLFTTVCEGTTSQTESRLFHNFQRLGF